MNTYRIGDSKSWIFGLRATSGIRLESLLRFAQREMIESVVVLDDILQSHEPAIMIEPAFRVAPESGKRGGTIHVCRRAVRLKRIHTDFARSMKIIPWLSEERWHMAARTFPLAIEDFLATLCRTLVKALYWWFWRRNRQLVEVKRGQLWGHPVWHTSRVARSALRGYWILLGIAKPGVVERAGAVHFRSSNVRIPVRHGAKPRPGMQVHAGQS
jgi:hypothetical protein